MYLFLGLGAKTTTRHLSDTAQIVVKCQIEHFYFICITVTAERCSRCHSQRQELKPPRDSSWISVPFSVEMHMAVIMLAITTTSKEALNSCRRHEFN